MGLAKIVDTAIQELKEGVIVRLNFDKLPAMSQIEEAATKEGIVVQKLREIGFFNMKSGSEKTLYICGVQVGLSENGINAYAEYTVTSSPP